MSKYLHKEFNFCTTETTTPLHEDRLRHALYIQMNDRNTMTKWAKCRGGECALLPLREHFRRAIRKKEKEKALARSTHIPHIRFFENTSCPVSC